MVEVLPRVVVDVLDSTVGLDVLLTNGVVEVGAVVLVLVVVEVPVVEVVEVPVVEVEVVDVVVVVDPVQFDSSVKSSQSGTPLQMSSCLMHLVLLSHSKLMAHSEISI